MKTFDNTEVELAHVLYGAPVERYYPNIELWVIVHNTEFYPNKEYRIASGFKWVRMYLYDNGRGLAVATITDTKNIGFLENLDMFVEWLGEGVWYDSNRSYYST